MCVLNYDRLGSKEHKLEGEVSTPPGNEGDLCRRWQIIRRTDGCSFDIEGGEGGELGEGAGTEGRVRRMLAMNESLLHLAKQPTLFLNFRETLSQYAKGTGHMGLEKWTEREGGSYNNREITDKGTFSL